MMRVSSLSIVPLTRVSPSMSSLPLYSLRCWARPSPWLFWGCSSRCELSRFGRQNNSVSIELVSSLVFFLASFPENWRLMTRSDHLNPDLYLLVPVVGMLCGSAITGISLSLDYILKELRYVIYFAPIGRVSLVAAAKSAILQRRFLVHRSLRHIARS
jgi:hypothetical protein